jgi:hypothetical protein
MKPASGLCPKCCANETVLRSIDTNIAPSSKYTGASTTRPGAGAPWPRRFRGLASRTISGSVARWATNHNVPPRHNNAATPMPAAGNTSVASSVTAAGPTMKHSSSATDSKENAACSRGVPASSALHRDRTMVPSAGMVAPAIAPGAKNAQVGSFSSTVAIRVAVATANTVSRGSRIRR